MLTSGAGSHTRKGWPDGAHPCVVANKLPSPRARHAAVKPNMLSTNGSSSVDLVYGARHVNICERDIPTYAVYLVRLEWTCEQTRQTSPRRSWTERYHKKGNDTLPQTAQRTHR